MKKMCLRTESGSMITEFLFVAPMLGAMIFAGLELNMYYEMKQNALISARNLGEGASYTKNSSVSPYMDGAGKLTNDGGIRNTVLEEQMGMGAKSIPLSVAGLKDGFLHNDGPMQTQVPWLHARVMAHAFTANRLGSPSGLNSGVALADGFQQVMNITAPLSSGVHTISNGFAATKLAPFLNMDDRVKKTQVDMSLNGAQSDFANAYNKLMAMASRNDTQANRGGFFSTTSTYYTANAAGYHGAGDSFKNTALFGVALGFASSNKVFTSTDSDKYNQNCQFHPMHNGDCRETGNYAKVIRTVSGIARAIDCAVKASAFFTGGATAAAKALLDEALKKAISEAESRMIQAGSDAVRNAIQDQVSQFGSLGDQISSGLTNTISSQLGNIPTPDVGTLFPN